MTQHSDQIEFTTPEPFTTLTRAFPTDTLPGPMRRFVEEGAKALPAPPDFLAVPALVSAGAAIGNTRRIRLKTGWEEPAQLYAAIVSDSGSMKSPALEKATKSVKDHQTTNCRTWTSDATVEGLCLLLRDHPRGVELCRDELSGWTRSMNQYKGGKGSDQEFFLSNWGGQPYTIDRAKDGGTSIWIPRPCVSVVGTITPDVLPELDAGAGKADGFLARILFAWPDAVPPRWTHEMISPEALSAYHTLFDRLYAIPYDPETGPLYLDLTHAAQAYFIRWHDKHMAEAETRAKSPFLQGAYAKLKGYCARLALIHAVCTDPDTKVVDIESVAAAAAMVDYFKAQAFKVDAIFSRGKNTPVEQCKAAIRRQLSACRCIEKRDLQRRMHHKGEIYNQALSEMSKAEILIEGKVIKWNW